MLFCYRWTLTINTEKNLKRTELLVGDSLNTISQVPQSLQPRNY
jgi:hypothetical protein